MSSIIQIELCKAFAQEVCGYKINGLSSAGIPIMEVPGTDGKASSMEVTRLLTSLSTLFREIERFCQRPRVDRPWIRLYFELHYYVGRQQSNGEDYHGWKCEMRASIADIGASTYWGTHDFVLVFGESMAECLMEACIQGKRRVGVARFNSYEEALAFHETTL